jgi:DNA invertase Pin-like site-specific DNA recombinase
MQLGYVRVSDKDQNPERQIEKLKWLGLEERFIFVDKASGKNFERPQYQAMKRIIREGDLIYIDSLDRLGRNYDGIIREWKEITRGQGADIVILDNEALFDSRKYKTMGDIGKLLEDQLLSLLSYVAEQERDKIRRRQREGIDLALAKKRPYGRPRAKITDKYRSAWLQWKKGKITAVKAMSMANVKPTTFYKLAKQLDEEYKGEPCLKRSEKHGN